MPTSLIASLKPEQLTVSIPQQMLAFADTRELESDPDAWIGQAEAEKAARFGLGLQHPGFHLMVVGMHGSGRTGLMWQLARRFAAQRLSPPDRLYVFNFESPQTPLLVEVRNACGHLLVKAWDQALRQFAKAIPALLMQYQPLEADEKKPLTQADIVSIKQQTGSLLESFLEQARELSEQYALQPEKLHSYFAAYVQDVLDNLEILMPNQDSESLLESYLSRFRAHLLVDQRGLHGAPIIYDDDPSFQSLFGALESSGDQSSNTAEFLRVRAGNLLRAHGGMLMLHVRDILADQQAGSQILEKLHRVLRNQRLQMEEASNASSQAHGTFSPEPIALDFKLILIATHEEFNQLQEDVPDFVQYFPVKVEFADRLPAHPEHYAAIARLIANTCKRLQLWPFDPSAVARLIIWLQRRIDDQRRISSDFSPLMTLMTEAHALAQGMHPNSKNAHLESGAPCVTVQHVQAALDLRLARHQSIEQQLREAILDDEVMISTRALAVGQINALTHIDVGDHSFGSPVRITARCFAGNEGVMNIDREVQMTGPNHDKGLLILRHWLSANFASLTPLSLSASLVFEQEYMGVEGDSASCAELFALLSALSGVPLKQGIAVTGALNQHGEVMPIGGVNEKIEGYFRICQAIGLDGMQGVIIPRRNQTHLMLDDAVITAVREGQFHIYAIDHVAEGMALLTGESFTSTDAEGQFLPDSLMGRVREKLIQFKTMYERNRQTIVQSAMQE